PLAGLARDLERPREAQERSLRAILARNAGTEFGRAARFGAIARLDGGRLWREFRAAVPIRPYDAFAPWVERLKAGEGDVLVPGRPEMFSLTSGSASEPKFCPVTRAFILEHHRQHLLWMHGCHRDHPGINAGKYLVVASPAEMGRTAGGIPYGSMSGKQLADQSIPVRRRLAVPVPIAALEPAGARWFNLLLFALAREDLRVVAAVNPSTLTLLADRLERDAEELLDCLENGLPAGRDAARPPLCREIAARFRPRPARARALRQIRRAAGRLVPSDAWPELRLILTWQGGPAALHLPRVEELWGPVPRRCFGLRASEGTFSLPLRDNDPSGVLAVGGHVMEFLPASDDPPAADAPALGADQLELGGVYRLLITTSGGFYRYDLGDQVRVTGFNRRTPEIAFERRSGALLSAVGEKVTERQAAEALREAAGGLPLNGFTLTWELVAGRLGYVLAVEWRNGEDELRRDRAGFEPRLRELAASFDAGLRRRNCEYDAKREDGRLLPPRCLPLADRAYENFRARLAALGRPDGQLKPPVLAPPPGPGRAPVKGCPIFDHLPQALL
ncbi:MAG: GH3 auxin-responsive promoter family protein, partial [Planctomycetota bacterium]|nr:GH3 auxin-responsive promoter family protein [Planctomycetota bacterium]